ncbi:MAG: hypoxanthine-guanine phosphoribosyltransferase [Immundisolibacteraceae bacterium]|nr:hypoxanthine-guanine phosphoribosyltransferase [Immundisolibacteraceae bacterium]
MPQPVTLEEITQIRHQADLLVKKSEIEQAITELASAITRDYSQRNPLLLLALKGGCHLGVKLMEQLDFPLQIDVLQMTRYRDGLSGGSLQILAEPATPLVDRSVLIVDDILDQGITLQGMMDYCNDQQPTSVGSVVLVDKQCNRPIEISADYVGLQAPDRYLFGCGMDYKGYWRNLPELYAVAGS